MGKFATRFCAASCPALRIGAGWLLAASLLTVVAAWAASRTAPYGSPDRNMAQPSAAGAIMVVYPDVGEPYRSIFAQIVGGIEEKAAGRVVNFAIGANVKPDELNDALRRQGIKVAIALGRQGMKAAAALDGNIGVVVGGVSAPPGGEARAMQVNSLSPDPALLFSRLKEMLPKMRRVFVVYDPRQNGWLIRQAREAARAHGLELEAYDAQDLRGAMHAYQGILASADPRRDAIWLPQDPVTAEEGSVVPLVLQESWTRGLAVFSSNVGHVKRGALFSLYPDNAELGRRLAASALALLSSGADDTSGMVPLRAVQVAVNLRTAKHLGVDNARVQDADSAFPER